MTNRCELPREIQNKQMMFILQFELSFTFLKRIPALGWIQTEMAQEWLLPSNFIAIRFSAPLQMPFLSSLENLITGVNIFSCLSDVLFFLGRGGLLPLALAGQGPVRLCLTITLDLITFPSWLKGVGQNQRPHQGYKRRPQEIEQYWSVKDLKNTAPRRTQGCRNGFVNSRTRASSTALENSQSCGCQELLTA